MLQIRAARFNEAKTLLSDILIPEEENELSWPMEALFRNSLISEDTKRCVSM